MLTNIGYPYMENGVNVRDDYQVECFMVFTILLGAFIIP